MIVNRIGQCYVPVEQVCGLKLQQSLPRQMSHVKSSRVLSPSAFPLPPGIPAVGPTLPLRIRLPWAPHAILKHFHVFLSIE
jgi:hypothetical protein